MSLQRYSTCSASALPARACPFVNFHTRDSLGRLGWFPRGLPLSACLSGGCAVAGLLAHWLCT
jgi:hypothetical protein